MGYVIGMERRVRFALGIGLAVLVAGGGIYYFAGPDNGATWADASDPALVAEGKTVYAEHCASCHGKNLEGQPNWRASLPDGTLPSPPHDETGHTWHHPDRLLFDYTKLGGKKLIPGNDFNSAMPGFEESLSDHQIWAVLAYIKSTWPADIRRRQEMIDRRSVIQRSNR